MKVIFKNYLAGYTGTVDGIIFYWDPRLQRIVARSKPKMRALPVHKTFGDTVRNLMAIDVSPGYRADLRSYAERSYGLAEFKGIRPIWNNLYLKIMHGLKRIDPSLDLISLTRAEIVSRDLPCRTVKRAVAAGLLPKVRGWETLEQEL